MLYNISILNSYPCHPSPYTTNLPAHTHKYILKWAAYIKRRKVLYFNTLSICFIYFKTCQRYENFHHLCLAVACVCVSTHVFRRTIVKHIMQTFLSSMKWYKDDMKIFDLPQCKRYSLISPTLKFSFRRTNIPHALNFSQCMLLLKVVIYWKCV